VFPVRYELGFYFPEGGILHSRRRENLKSYTTGADLKRKKKVSYCFKLKKQFVTLSSQALC
jgi:hypothetical protein